MINAELEYINETMIEEFDRSGFVCEDLDILKNLDSVISCIDSIKAEIYHYYDSEIYLASDLTYRQLNNKRIANRLLVGENSEGLATELKKRFEGLITSLDTDIDDDMIREIELFFVTHDYPNGISWEENTFLNVSTLGVINYLLLKQYQAIICKSKVIKLYSTTANTR